MSSLTITLEWPDADLSPNALKELLRYDADSGKLFWLPRPESAFATKRAFGAWNSRYPGAEAFKTVDAMGYCVGFILGKQFKAHRIIWAMQTGQWPDAAVDHKNGIPGDNRWANLRLATKSQNGCNSRLRKDNTSGFKGVTFDKRRGRWRAEIVVAPSDRRYLGEFLCRAAAAIAYARASKEFHQEFGRLA